MSTFAHYSAGISYLDSEAASVEVKKEKENTVSIEVQDKLNAGRTYKK